MQPLSAKVESVMNWQISKMKKQVQSFLGLASYYRRFIPHFSTLAAPLTELCHKYLPIQFKWTESRQQAFDALKRSLIEAPVLKAPDFSKKFIVQTDASQTGLRVVLLQQSEEGNLHPVAYLSHKQLSRETQYAVGELECLAVV